MRHDQLDAMLAATRAHAHEPLLFLAAFDGVLARYRTDPAQVRMTLRQRTRLNRLRRAAGVSVGIVSGRPLADLRDRLGLGDQFYYIGLHGLETAGPGFSGVRQGAIDAYHDRLLETVDQLAPVLAGVAGVRLEFKKALVALHTREAGPEDAVWSRFQLLNAAADLMASGTVRAVRGHDVLELVPNVGTPRADAVAALREAVEARRRRPVFMVYIGEDTADDDAFAALGPEDVGAVVGRRASRARFHLSFQDVDQFIDRLLRERGSRRELLQADGRHLDA